MADHRNDHMAPATGTGSAGEQAVDGVGPLNEVYDEVVVEGVGVAPGIAIGPAYLFTSEFLKVAHEPIGKEEAPREVARFDQALLRTEKDLKKIAAITREKLGEESASIFEAQAMMLRDTSLYEGVYQAIRRELCKAEYAVQVVMSSHRRRLEASPNEYLRERSGDLLDVQQRLMRNLSRRKMMGEIRPETLVIARTLSAADIMLFSRREVLGCAIDFGGATSHVSIIARSLGVPAVVGLGHLSEIAQSGAEVILDGFEGKVIVHPSLETVHRYRTLQRRYRRLLEDQKRLIPLAAETLDRVRIQLRANLELVEELDLVERYNAEGIGLFRTEIPFMLEGRLDPSENELFSTYRQVVERVKPDITTFRLLDLGGDKLLPVPHRESNPFLGWRGVRILLDRPDLMKLQLRALLRASAYGPIRILVPMVAHMSEFREVRRLMEEVWDELREKGYPTADSVPLGIMVEVPSVVITIDHFAAAADFFSIGTNDLTQYTLAVDRGNDLVADAYDELHPAVLQLIGRTVEAGRRHGIPVGLCGQLASNPRATPVLVGLGLRDLSAPPSYLPEIKRVIRSLDTEEAKRLAAEVLAMEDVHAIHQVLDDWLDDHACGFRQIFEERTKWAESSPLT